MSTEVNFKLFLNFPFRHPCFWKIGFVYLLLMIKVSLLTKKQEKKMCSALVKKTHFSLSEIEVLLFCICILFLSRSCSSCTAITLKRLTGWTGTPSGSSSTTSSRWQTTSWWTGSSSTLTHSTMGWLPGRNGFLAWTSSSEVRDANWNKMIN